MSLISKRRLVSLASTSALVATMAVASLPGATLAATPALTDVTVGSTIFKALYVNPAAGVLPASIDARGADIAVYFGPDYVGTGTVTADISGAKYYAVVADGAKVNVTGSKVHDIGTVPFDGVQVGRTIVYINGASGKISGNTISNFQKNGIEIHGPSSATIEKNVITGRGPITDIAQNGIVIRDGAKAVVKNNTISGFEYVGNETYATGVLNYLNATGTFAASGNKFAGNDVNIDGANGTPGGTVRP